MRKLIIWLTIFSVMNLIGCYYQEQMNPEDYSFDESDDIIIITRDKVYNFIGNDYSLVNDTLIGIMSKKLDERTIVEITIGIPVEDIESVKVERSNTTLSILLGFGIVVGVLFVLGIGAFNIGN